jgi:hypothetical protein
METKMIEQRLQELRIEYARGEQRLRLLRQEQQSLHDTLQRISGAIQILEELLAREHAGTNGVPADQPQ